MDVETRYSEIERLCLCLYFSCTKLRHYLLSNECIIVCKADVIKYMLSAPVLKGRLGKWMLALTEYDLRFESAKTVKAQVLADLIVEHGGNLHLLLNQFRGYYFLMVLFAKTAVESGSWLYHPREIHSNSLLR